jgi:hypothetical protein
MTIVRKSPAIFEKPSPSTSFNVFLKLGLSTSSNVSKKLGF